MQTNDLIADGYGRVHDAVHSVVEGIKPAYLGHRVDSEANTIAWLIWHLARVQDDHIADVAGSEQVWTADGWADRFDCRLMRA